MPNLVMLLMILPLLGAGLCLLGKFFRRPPFAPIVSVLTLLSAGGLLLYLYPAGRTMRLVYTVGGWPASVGIQQAFDGLAWLTCGIVLGIGVLALCFALAEKQYDVMFYVFYLICIAGMIGVILAADLFNLFVCFEIVGLASYILIAYLHKGHAILASLKYLLLSSLGMGLVLLGIFIIYQHTGSLSLIDVSAKAAHLPAYSRQIAMAVAALVIGIGVRAAFMPFHAWLPEAHANAPHPVSALLSGVVIKVAWLAIWRIILAFQAYELQSLFIGIGAVTALIGVCWALAQTDCKQLLAWHSVSQMGYILASFGVGSSVALTASFLHILNHALFKSLLFLCIGSVIYMTGERQVKRLPVYRLTRAAPLLAFTFLIGAASITGLPPLNGFLSKKTIEYSLKAYPLAYYAIWLTGVGTVASFLKLSAIFRTPPVPSVEPPPQIQRRLPGLAYLPLILLAASCIVIGGLGQIVLRQAAMFLSMSIDRPYSLYSASNVFSTILTVGLGVALYVGIRSQRGKRVLTQLQRLRLSLDQSLYLVIAGFVTLALFVAR